MFRTKPSCENEARFIQDRIQLVEKHAAELCSSFSAYARKAARLRDKFDDLAKTTLAYSEEEDINNSLSDGLSNFASSMSLLGDYGDLRVQNIDNKIVGEFSQYESICKHVKEEVKQIYAARDRELNRKKQLDKIKERNPRNRQQILQAETELVKASTEVSKTIHNLEEQITTFERQKLHDIKAILLDFLTGEIGYHAKALELFTKAYKDVQNIDEDTDLEDFQIIRGKIESDFKKTLRRSENIPSSASSKRTLFRASQSLGSIGNLFSTPKKQQQKKLQRNVKMNKSRSEEILDSPRKLSYNSSDESEESESDDSRSQDTSGDVKKDVTSRFIAKKYLK